MNTVVSGVKPAPVGTRLGLEDERSLVDLVTREASDGHRELTLDVPDMRCASCAARIEQHLSALRGVGRVRINPARQQVLLTYDPVRLTLSAITDAVTDAGYTPVPTTRTNDDPELAAERRTHLKRLGVAGIGMMQVMMFSIALYAGAGQDMTPFYESLMRWVALAFTTPVLLYSAAPFFRNALSSAAGLFRPRGVRLVGLTMDVPVALALAIAYGASVVATVSGGDHVYFDSVTMFTFLLLTARLLEQSTRLKLARYDNWLAMLPAHVDLERNDHPERLPVTAIRPGDRVRVAAGARVPIDGWIIEGASDVDESPLTGETRPLPRGVGDRVFAGTVNTNQALVVEANTNIVDTRMAAIHRLAQRATFDKPPTVQLADSIARYFVLGVITLSLVTYLAWQWFDPGSALAATIAVLVVSCPCALSLATPAAITAAATALRRAGFVATRAHVIERLAKVTHVVFDKTGTLTGGKPELVAVEPVGALSAKACERIAVALEQHTDHPLSQAFAAADAPLVASTVRIHDGRGITGVIDGVAYRLGSAEFCRIARPARHRDHTTIYLAEDSGDRCIPLAEFSIRLWLRDDANATLAAIRRLGISAEILSGDSMAPTAEISVALDDLPYGAGCSPEAKLAHIQALTRKGEAVAMVGDGINDVPGLAAATVSIAPADSTDLAKTTSDAILLGRGLGAIARAIEVARRTRAIVKQNVMWALIYNVAAIPLAAAGLVPPWLAAIGMSASSLGVTLNAMRLTRNEATTWK